MVLFTFPMDVHMKFQGLKQTGLQDTGTLADYIQFSGE